MIKYLVYIWYKNALIWSVSEAIAAKDGIVTESNIKKYIYSLTSI